jgi:bicarbonate transport system substrate-binding protein
MVGINLLSVVKKVCVRDKKHFLPLHEIIMLTKKIISTQGAVMTFFNQISRRKFIVTAGASASAVLLKGCLGNPPETTGGTQSAATAQPVANVSPEQAPEVNTVKLGYIPIVEAAPLIIAKEKGFLGFC